MQLTKCKSGRLCTVNCSRCIPSILAKYRLRAWDRFCCYHFLHMTHLAGSEPFNLLYIKYITRKLKYIARIVKCNAISWSYTLHSLQDPRSHSMLAFFSCSHKTMNDEDTQLHIQYLCTRYVILFSPCFPDKSMVYYTSANKPSQQSCESSSRAK